MEDKNNSRNRWIWTCCVLGVSLVLFLIGTFFDEKISDSLYRGTATINTLIEIVGKMPAFLLAMFACVAMLHSSMQKNKKVEKYLVLVLWYVMGIAFSTFTFLDLFDYITSGIKSYLFSLIAGAVLFNLVIFISTYFRSLDFSFYKKWAIYAVLSIGLILVFTYAAKMIFNRPRYEDILENTASFLPWYKIGEDGSSFPSGHVAMIAALYVIIPLTKFNESLKGKENTFYAIITLFVVLTVFSRIIMGKHFLTDTMVSVIVAFIVTRGLDLIFFGLKGDNIGIDDKNILNRL